MSGGCREILTLQFGHYANMVGAHWWNLQELSFSYDANRPPEINHDVLYREGLNLKNEVTFTPRLLLVDLKGSLKALPQFSELYDLPDTSGISENVEVIREEPEVKNTFQQALEGGTSAIQCDNIEAEMSVWSDFLYTRFHPRTINIVRDYQHDNSNSEKPQFLAHPLGVNLWKREEFCEDFADKIRNYVEECDHFEGFHLLSDSNDAFSGLSSACLVHLRDEYTSKTILGFPLASHSPLDACENLNEALQIEALTEHCSLFTPLNLQNRPYKHISYNSQLQYHTSAILAATLDTFTINYRLKKTKNSLGDLCIDFSAHGRKAAMASVALPFPLKTNEDFIDCLDNWQGLLTESVTPNCQVVQDENMQIFTLRGIPETRLKRPPHCAGKQRDMAAYKCESLQEMLEFYLNCTSYRSKSAVTVCGEQMPIKPPYPQFFNNLGEPPNVAVNVLAGLHSGKFVGAMFDDLIVNLEGVKIGKMHQFVSEGVESDAIKECLECILTLRDCYADDNLI